MQWQKPKDTIVHTNAMFMVHNVEKCGKAKTKYGQVQLEMVSNKCALVPFVSHILSCFWNQL